MEVMEELMSWHETERIGEVSGVRDLQISSTPYDDDIVLVYVFL